MYISRSCRLWLLCSGICFTLLLAGCVSTPPSIISVPAATSPLQGKILNTYRNQFPFFGVAWSPDGKRIATGDASGAIQVRNATTGAIIFTSRGHSGFVWAIAWSPDGTRIASASWDKTVQVWDARTGRHILTYRGHTDLVLAVAWSPDSRHIVSGSSDDTVQVWDVATGERIFIYSGHTSTVGALAWSPSGNRIASVAEDIEVWEADE